jgi:hypothetical protein
MKQLLSISAALAMAFSVSAFAADKPASAPMTAQQTKMGDCNKQATGKTGDDRKAFMKGCLSASGAPAAAPAKMTQQEKMKKCNADATGKTGDDRKAYMKSCLSA